jgi:hypothetical protein
MGLEGLEMTPPRRKAVSRVRNVGASSDLTDDQLRDSNSPDVLANLSPSQLRRRRVLRQQQASEARRKRMSKLPKRQKQKTMYCTGVTEQGTTCQSKHVNGSDYCMWHMEKAELKRLGIRDPREAVRVAPVLKAPEMLRQIMETHVEQIVRPYFEGLGIKLIGYDEETGSPIVEEIEGGGLKLYGESKDGDIEMSNYPDIVGRVAIAEKLLDRVYGKPKQSTTIEGGVNPIRIQPVRTGDRAMEVASILAQARALPPAPDATPHDGRRRRDTADVIDMPERK